MRIPSPLPGAVILVLALGLAAGCGRGDSVRVTSALPSSSAPVRPPTHSPGEPLTVWARPPQAEALRTFARTLESQTGQKIEVREVDGDLKAEFLKVATTTGAPDLVVGDHTWVDQMVEAKAIEPVRMGSSQREGFNAGALRAVMRKEDLYGAPYAVESVVLFRNTELAPDPPQTIEEVVAVGDQLRRAGRVREGVVVPVGESGDAQVAYPLFTSAGGYLFGVGKDELPNLDDLGLLESEAVTAFTRLGGLGERGPGLLRRSVDLTSAVHTFTTSGAPFLIAPPSALTEIKRSGLGYGISAVPGFYGGKAPQPFVTVHCFFVPRGSQRAAAAQQFLTTYLTDPDLPRAMYGELHLAPVLTAAFVQIDAKDPDVRRLLDSGRGGVFLPPAPALPAVLSAFAKAEVAAVSGQDVQKAVATAANEIIAALAKDRPRPSGGRPT